MSDLPYFRHYASDHQARFLGLNRDENSAYHDIRDHIWIAGGALPDDDNLLARLTRCTLEEWLRIRGKLMAFFKISHGLWRHVELSQQKQSATKTHTSLSVAGHKGADKRWKHKRKLNNRAAISQANEQAISEANAQAYGLSMAIQESDSERKNPPSSLRETFPPTVALPAAPVEPASGNGAKGARLSDDWMPDPKGRDYAQFMGLDPDATLEQFRDYWIAQPGIRGRKTDWAATWRTWCRREGRSRALSRPLNAPSPRTVQTEAFYHAAIAIERSRNC